MNFPNRDELFASLPPIWPHDLMPEIHAQLAKTERAIVVLDDDPTGTQTVHDVPILTRWEVRVLETELRRGTSLFYVLTNSRALNAPDANDLAHEIGRNLRAASQSVGREIAVVSRSDSTLRGHFPGEVDALCDGLGRKPDGVLLIPAFLEGGRFTINDIHYVADGEHLIPAAQTPFARDASFGYKHSDLKSWVEEKTRGRVRAQDVVSVSLNDLRIGGAGRVAEVLCALKDASNCIVNAAHERDLEVFVLGLLQAESAGKTFVYRTAASLVPIRAGLKKRALLSRDDLHLPRGGGLIVAGSYVPKTTAQLQMLRCDDNVRVVEVDVRNLLNDQTRATEIARAAQSVEIEYSKSGRDVLLMTSRALVTGSDAASSLEIGARVSSALVEVVRSLPVAPRYILAKGGVTSSDIATKALNVQRAIAVGQITPGVPVWKLGTESRFPDLNLIVFPGNVGHDETLADVVKKLRDVDDKPRDARPEPRT